MVSGVKGRLNARKLLGSLAVVFFAFSAVAVSSSWVDQAHAAKMGGKKT